jgi:hypothetical protein
MDGGGHRGCGCGVRDHPLFLEAYPEISAKGLPGRRGDHCAASGAPLLLQGFLILFFVGFSLSICFFPSPFRVFRNGDRGAYHPSALLGHRPRKGIPERSGGRVGVGL